MAVLSLEERVDALEAEVARLRERLAAERPTDAVPWWEKIYGTFADNPAYEEAMALGREYRESLRPRHEESTKE